MLIKQAPVTTRVEAGHYIVATFAAQYHITRTGHSAQHLWVLHRGEPGQHLPYSGWPTLWLAKQRATQHLTDGNPAWLDSAG